MIELEILVEVYDPFDVALSHLSKYNFNGKKEIIDKYFYDPLRPALKPYCDNKLYASFRTRKKNNQVYLTYKNDHYENGHWQYSDEYEVSVSAADTLDSIIANLGLKELLTLQSEKHFFIYKDYEIVLENVRNLGTFLEVELKKEITENDVHSHKCAIQSFINSLDLHVSEELNCGKPELYLARNKIII